MHGSAEAMEDDGSALTFLRSASVWYCASTRVPNRVLYRAQAVQTVQDASSTPNTFESHAPRMHVHASDWLDQSNPRDETSISKLIN